jgi:RNA polymerase sigma-70 factor (ECF subfamily)
MLKGNDEQLVANYLKGDEKSLEVLIQQYLKPIFSFIYRYIGDIQEAEDITQEVFVRMWRNIRKFDKQKSFKTWIFSIAKNASIDFLKKKKAIPFSEFENEKGENVFVETLADSAPLPNELFERADITQKLTLMMEKLSPKYRLVLFLRYNDHFTFREIAEISGESINTIKTRHRRGVAILKKLLQDK